MAFNNNNSQPRLVINQQRLRSSQEKLKQMMTGGVVAIPYTTDGRILLVNERSNWVLPHDMLHSELEYNNGYPNYAAAAARTLGIAIGIPNNFILAENARMLGGITLPGEMNNVRHSRRDNGLQFVAIPFAPNVNFNNLYFAVPDGIEGADLITISRAQELIREGNVTDLFTLVGFMKFMAN